MEILISIIRGMLGLGPAKPKDHYAGLPPGDLEAYWTAHGAIDEAERAGNKQAAFTQFGIKNDDHWEKVQATFVRHHGATPEFSLAASTASFKQQMRETMDPSGVSGYRFPAEYMEPVDGITLDKLVLARVKTEAVPPAQRASVLSSMGMSEQSFASANAGWSARMGGNADPMAANILGGLQHTYEAQVRAVLSR